MSVLGNCWGACASTSARLPKNAMHEVWRLCVSCARAAKPHVSAGTCTAVAGGIRNGKIGQRDRAQTQASLTFETLFYFNVSLNHRRSHRLLSFGALVSEVKNAKQTHTRHTRSTACQPPCAHGPWDQNVHTTIDGTCLCKPHCRA